MEYHIPKNKFNFIKQSFIIKGENYFQNNHIRKNIKNKNDINLNICNKFD